MSSDRWETIKLEQNGKKQASGKICSGLDRPQKKEKKTKPLGERRKAVWRQQLMVLLGNTGVMGAGMAVALPSVTLGQLTDENEEFCLSQEEASWFCMYQRHDLPPPIPRDISSSYPIYVSLCVCVCFL